MEDLRFANKAGLQDQFSPKNNRSISIQDGSGKGNEIMNPFNALKSDYIYNKQIKPYGMGTKEGGFN